jgi:hypothetical protein
MKNPDSQSGFGALACARNARKRVPEMPDFFLEIEPGDCVPTTKERLDALERAVNSAPSIEAPKPTPVRSWLWSERTWVIPSIIAIAVVVIPSSFGVAYYVAGLEIDKHVGDKLGPALGPIEDDLSRVHKDIQQLSGDVRELKGIISVLQAPALTSKLSKLPPSELKARKDELQEIKNNLAAAPKDTPNLWPASFQVITLLSQAMYQLETIGRQPLSEFSNVRIGGFGNRGGLVSGRNVSLKGTIEGFTFENSVIHFDASTKLINVQFTHCVFIFPQDANPSSPLQQIGATLLASDLESVKITTG